jgi:predicted cobalt transporter CbtA
MHGRAVTVLYVLALVVTVVGTDILFFRHHFWARLLVNVGIVLVFVPSSCVSGTRLEVEQPDRLEDSVSANHT